MIEVVSDTTLARGVEKTRGRVVFLDFQIWKFLCSIDQFWTHSSLEDL